jgi:hypothetical protein
MGPAEIASVQSWGALEFQGVGNIATNVLCSDGAIRLNLADRPLGDVPVVWWLVRPGQHLAPSMPPRGLLLGEEALEDTVQWWRPPQAIPETWNFARRHIRNQLFGRENAALMGWSGITSWSVLFGGGHRLTLHRFKLPGGFARLRLLEMLETSENMSEIYFHISTGILNAEMPVLAPTCGGEARTGLTCRNEHNMESHLSCTPADFRMVQSLVFIACSDSSRWGFEDTADTFLQMWTPRSQVLSTRNTVVALHLVCPFASYAQVIAQCQNWFCASFTP